MKFSIIVPIYKVEEYLERCVKSLVNQTEKDIEIILVDDGSPDKCPEMCDEFAKMDNRIKVIHKENGGLSDARNAGIDVAKGEYIMFVDSDDYISEDACEKLCPFFGADIIVGDLEVIGGANYYTHDSSLLGKMVSNEEYLITSLKSNKFPVPVVLNAYRKSFLVENSLRFKVGILHEDEHFTPRAFLCAKSVAYSGVVFYYYIVRESSIMTTKSKERNADCVLEICDELEQIYKKIKNKKLRKLLLNNLADLCLTIHRSWQLSRYGKKYVRRKFVLRNAKKIKVRILALIYFVSPSLFDKIFKGWA